MGVHGEGVHAANIGVRYVAYFQAIFPMSVHHTHLKVKPPTRLRTAGMKLRFFFLLFSAVSPSQLLGLCILVVQLYSYVQQLAVQLAAYS